LTPRSFLDGCQTGVKQRREGVVAARRSPGRLAIAQHCVHHLHRSLEPDVVHRRRQIDIGPQVAQQPSW
jgi:hypothetical protein